MQVEARTVWPGLVFIASAFCFAILFYGGATQIYQLAITLFLLAGVTVWCWRVLGGRQFYWTPVHTALLAFSAFLCLQIFFSRFPENSSIVTWQFLSLPLVLVLCGRLTDERWHKLLGILSLPILTSVLWGYAEFFLGDGRASGPVIDPNSWASGMNFVFFLMLSLFLVVRNRYSILVFAFLLMLPAATFMSYSRVGTIVLFSGLGFVALQAVLIPRLRRKVGLAVLAVMISFAAVNFWRSADVATRHDEGYTLNVEAEGWTKRLAQWQAGVNQYLDHPVTGSGLGTFKLLYPAYRTEGDMDTAGNYLHNDYLQVLAEGGPLMLAFLLTFISFLLWQLGKNSLAFWQGRRVPHLEAIVLITAIGSVLAHALMNFTLYNFANQMLIGVALSRLLYLLGWTKRQKPKIQQAVPGKIFLVLAISYVALVNVADTLSADLVYRGGVIPVDHGGPEAEQQVYEVVSRLAILRPDVSTNRFAMATYFRTSFDQLPVEAEEARRSLAIASALEYQRGLELNPWNFEVRGYYASFLHQNLWLMQVEGITETPQSLIREGVKLTPIHVQSYLAMADLLVQEGKPDAAYRLLVDDALKWSALRYQGHERFRQMLFLRVLKEARKRDDRAALERLLLSMDGRLSIEAQ